VTAPDASRGDQAMVGSQNDADEGVGKIHLGKDITGDSKSIRALAPCD
jgi:hypothetical protein